MPLSTRPLTEDITILGLDHPGANDPAYRARRSAIAEIARGHRRQGGEVPDIAYTDEEHATWRAALSRLGPMHARRACAMYLRAKGSLAIAADRIPQLGELNRRLRDRGGFRLSPVEGLIDSRTFLSSLAGGAMLCTQYIRHASRPDYTPEPDVIHEVVGHAPTFTDPDFAAFTRRLGAAAAASDDRSLRDIERLYWFTVEFGLIREQGEVKAFGAGLLSSYGELGHCFSSDVERREFDVREVLGTPYDYSSMQRVLFIIPSFAALRKATDELLGALAAPSGR